MKAECNVEITDALVQRNHVDAIPLENKVDEPLDSRPSCRMYERRFDWRMLPVYHPPHRTDTDPTDPTNACS